MPATYVHPDYSPACLDYSVRHKHPFTVPIGAAQRCHCGSRTWIINVGGAMPASVSCERCTAQNRTATAWIAGYDQARREKAQVKPSTSL